MKRLGLVIAALVLLSCARPYKAAAQSQHTREEGGWWCLNAMSQSPATRESALPAAPMTLVVSLGGPPSDRIAAMARSLKYDPLWIYDFVRNRVSFAPYFGSVKGAERTLIDRAGNDMDQSSLMVQLLRASGYTSRYVVATAEFPVFSADQYDLARWMGVNPNQTAVITSLSQAGYPWTTNSPTTVTVKRTWVEFSSNGVWYAIDPAFKPSKKGSLSHVTTYVDTLLSQAGGVSHIDYTSGLNTTALFGYLNACAANIRPQLAALYPTAEIEDALAFWTPVTEAVSGLQTNMLRHLGAVIESRADSITNLYRSSLEFVHETWTNSLFMDEIAHRKLWYGYTNAGGAYPRAQLWLDNTVWQTETSTPANATLTLTVTPQHYFTPANRPAEYLLTRNTSNVYVVAMGFGGADTGRMKAQTIRELEQLTGSGVTNDDTRVVSASLHAIGQSWLQAKRAFDQMVDAFGGNPKMEFHNIGIVAQEGNYYVDLKNRVGARKYGLDPGLALVEGYVSCALEHASLEQLQGTNEPASSTVRLFDLANASGQQIFRATSGNWSVGANVRAQLQNYDSDTLTRLDGLIAEGGVCFLPKYGTITNRQWRGFAYADYVLNAMGFRAEQIIKGNLFGGFASTPGIVNNASVKRASTSSYLPPLNIPRPRSIEPVDLYSGAYLVDHADLTLDGPGGLSFSRSYDSEARNRKTILGWGWTHGYDMRAVVHSDPAAALGGRSLLDACAAITATESLIDLMYHGDDAKHHVVAALIARWLTDQLTDNAVSIAMGNQTLLFIRQPDGVYTPPPGVTMSLARSNGVFVLTQRNGPVYSFNAGNRIDRITDPDSNYVAFVYSAQTNLVSITNNFGQGVTLSYSGEFLTGLSDTAGRSIAYQYDTAGNLTNYVDPEGMGWAIAYDAAHRITSMTDPAGVQTIVNSYDTFSRVTNQVSASSNLWDFYTSDVRGIEEDPEGRLTIHEYDVKGRTVSRTEPDGARNSSSCDGHNHLIATVDPSAVTNLMSYDTNHNLLRQVEAVGTALTRTNRFAYDSLHRLAFATNAQGKVTSYQYNATHHPTNVTDSLGVSVQMGYADRGLMTSRSVAQGGQTLVSETRTYKTTSGQLESVTATDAGTTYFTFDARGDLFTTTDPNNHSSTNWYDKRRLVTTNANALGHMVRRTYSSNGLLRTVIDPRGAVVSNTWTKAYKPLAVYLPDGGMASNVYDSADRLVYQRNARQFWSTNLLDARGRVTNSLSTYENTRIAYDIMGRATSTVDAVSAEVVARYDILGRAEAARDPLGKWTWSAFDSLDRLLRATNALGRVNSFQYDDAGRMTVAKHPSNAQEDYTYDGLGRLRLFSDADGHPMWFGHDAQGRPTDVTNAESEVTQMRYDLAGLCTGRWDAASGWTRFQYDAADRLTNTVFSNATSVAASYDAGGNVTWARYGAVTQAFGYDILNRLTNAVTQVGSVSWSSSWRRDLNGNLTALTYPGGATVTCGYDAEDRLVKLTNNLAGGGVFTFDYDAAGRLTAIHYPNGVVASNVWDLADRLTEFRHSKSGALVLRRLAYDDVDRPIREEIDAGAIPKPTGESWRQETCDLADRVTSAFGKVEGVPATWSYGHDAAGNLLDASRTMTGTVATVSYRYDLAGRMIAITNGATVATYVYDASGSRVTRVEGGVTRYYALDYADGFKRPLAELNSAGAILRRYVWQGAMLLAVIESNGVVRYAHSDGQGSVLALTDSSGNVTDQFAYGPYGEPWARTGTNELPFRWLGGSGVVYAGDGLYLTHRRLYDSSLKTFLQPDPMGIAGGFNLYAYGNLNPLVYVDPLGLCADSGGIKPFPGNDFGLNALLAKDRMRNTNPTRFYEVYGNDRDVQIEMALGLMMNIALMAFDLPAGLGSARAVTTARSAAVGRHTVASMRSVQAMSWTGRSVGSTATRALRLPATRGMAPGVLGETLPNGQVFLRPGLSRAQQVLTLRHESVHAFFSPKGSGSVATFRQNLGQWGYDNSQLLRFTEEAIAETYSSRSLFQGISHSLVNGYVTPGRLLLEGSGVLGAGYLSYRLGGGE